VNDVKKIKIYILMELCDETLSDFLIKRQSMIETLLKDGLFTSENISNYLKIYLSLAKAIEYIHEKGIIHRDLKPANIFFKNEEVKVGDFGLATFDPDVKYSRNGVKMLDEYELGYHTKNVGTTIYASEEQLNSNYYDTKVFIVKFSLIYSL
jgi:translation initiation factor 2-alpha kinase 3